MPYQRALSGIHRTSPDLEPMTAFTHGTIYAQRNRH
jgi:hypothetical protein